MIKGCAVVTGASRGIGAAAALKLAESGYEVIVNYRSSKDKAEAVLERIKAVGSNGYIYRCDVSNRSDVDSMVSFALEKYSKIAVLVNNAGISRQQLFTDISQDDWNKMVSVNLTSVFNCCQSVLPSMLHHKSGRIINISSVWGVYGASCEVHYSAVKAGVIGLTKALAQETAPSGITVNAVAPGCIKTEMLTNEFDENTLTELACETPLGRLGTAIDVANTIAFLASDGASFITGQIIGVDGGFR